MRRFKPTIRRISNFVGGIYDLKSFGYRNKGVWRLVFGWKSVWGEMRCCRGEVLVRVNFFSGLFKNEGAIKDKIH